ncbi:hypothetical protein GmHk_20G057126 [Glycine max]|nr:hypothetical protein GmHk_20G057126 [Glycine max]
MAIITPGKIYQHPFPKWSKPLKDVATPRRFIYEALQKGGVIPHSGHEEDSCLLHPGELHDMETCLAVKELLQRMIDQGRLEVGDEGREKQHICMHSADERSFGRPKPLVIYFTKDAASQKPRYPSAAKPIPFPYQNSHAVPWRYTPPSERKEETTDISLLSTKVTNITGLSGVTRSSCVFAPPDLPTQPTNVKGKAKMVEEQNNKTTPTPKEDIPVKGLPEKRDGCDKKEVSLEEASEFLRIIQQSEFKVIEQLNKTPARVSLLELLMSFEPHQALPVKGQNHRRQWSDAGMKLKAEINQGKTEMALKKLSAKRSRRDAVDEGTSVAPEFDSHHFRSAEHQQRFEAIKGLSFHRERRVQLRDDEYTDFQEEIAHQHWTSLWIPFDAYALSQFLGYPLVLEEGQECEFSQRRNMVDGFDEEAIA